MVIRVEERLALFYDDALQLPLQFCTKSVLWWIMTYNQLGIRLQEIF